MPIFEYKCQACGNIFEVISFSRQVKTPLVCNKCKSDKVEKILSASNVRSGTGLGLPVSSPAAGCGSKSGFT